VYYSNIEVTCCWKSEKETINEMIKTAGGIIM